MSPFRGRKIPPPLDGGGGNFGAAQLVCFSGTLISNGQLVYCDFQAEASVWLFKSPLAGGGGTLWRPHSLLVLSLLSRTLFYSYC